MAFSFSPSAKGFGARAGTCTSSYPCKYIVEMLQQQMSGTQSQQRPETPEGKGVHLTALRVVAHLAALNGGMVQL